MERKILLTDTADEPGLIYKITEVCFLHGLNIIKNQEYVATDERRFFMRTYLEGDFNDRFLPEGRRKLGKEADVRLVNEGRKHLVVLVTKEAHCLGDLLMKHYSGTLNATIDAVIGNYDVLRDLVERFDVPFELVSHEGLSREEHCHKVLEAVQKYSPDYVVLAKYMRIITPEFLQAFRNRVINIHHSFLPAFIGAKPYQQAFDRGVKIIGATAHFVTEELDNGPIIEQDVIKVDHNFSAEMMARSGRDVERLVLDRALTDVLEDRVFVHGNKTVVFK